MDLFKLLKEAIENPAPANGMTPEAFVQGFHQIVKHFMASVLKDTAATKRILAAKQRGLSIALWDAVNRTYPGLWAKLGRNNQLQLDAAVRDYYEQQFRRRATELMQLQRPKLSDLAAQKPAPKPLELRSVQKLRQQQAQPQPQA